MVKLTVEDPISSTLNKFKHKELLDLINGLKPVVSEDRSKAQAVLEANPDLTYAVVQAMLLMGLVNEEVINDVVAAPAVPSTPAPPTPAPAPAPVAAPVDKFAGIPPEQVAMIKQILSMTEEQINLLPADQQQQVRTLKTQYS